MVSGKCKWVIIPKKNIHEQTKIYPNTVKLNKRWKSLLFYKQGRLHILF